MTLDAAVLPPGLLAGFDAAQLAAIQAELDQARGRSGEAQAHRVKATRYHARAAQTEARLAELLPARFDRGESWDVISNGDLDAMSYLRHALAAVTHFDRVLVSTWRVQRAELEQLRDWIDAGRIDHFTLIASAKLETQMNESYELAQELKATYGCTVKLIENHSKVTLCENVAEGYRLVIRGSANLNTNPRVEQVSITRDDGLHAFYSAFFDALRSRDRR